MENIVERGGVRLWTQARGQDKKGSVLLCSGGPGCCDYLSDVAQMIEDEYRVIRFEQRGCGRSGTDGPYDIETTLLDMEAIRCFYGIDAWVVGGHSWGANLALFYALKFPARVQSVLYLAGNGLQRDRDWSEAYHKNREKCGEEMPKMDFPGNEAVNRGGNASYYAYIKRPTLWKELSQLEKKTLFLCGEEDIRPSWPVRQISELMPDATFVTIQHAAHYLWLRQPEEVEKQLRRFLGLQGEKRSES